MLLSAEDVFRCVFKRIDAESKILLLLTERLKGEKKYICVRDCDLSNLFLHETL